MTIKVHEAGDLPYLRNSRKPAIVYLFDLPIKLMAAISFCATMDTQSIPEVAFKLQF